MIANTRIYWIYYCIIICFENIEGKMSRSLGYGFISIPDGLLDDFSLFLHVMQLLLQFSVFLLQLDVLQEEEMNCVRLPIYTVYLCVYTKKTLLEL